MSSARKFYGKFRASDGRIKLATLLGVSSLVAAIALLVGVLPAIAGAGDPSGTWAVAPDEIRYGGGSGACFADVGDLPSAAMHELHINNPVDGTFTGPDGTQVIIDVHPLGTGADDFHFDFVFVDDPSELPRAAFDVVVNGGAKNTHFDYDAGPGPKQSDTRLHAPTKGSSKLFQLSHINICYDINPFADLNVTKTPVPEADPFLANVGETVEFAIDVSNASESTVDATGVEVTDTLPTGMTFAASHPGNVDWSESNGFITQTIAPLAPGESVTLSLFVAITGDAAGQPVTNQVSVSGNEDGTDDSADSDPSVTVTADVSGVKFHDRDTDGNLDATEEIGLPGWTITAFPFPYAGEPGTDTTTIANGTYTIANLEPGTYTVCEMAPEQTGLAADDPSKLPTDGTGFNWAWTQSDLPDSVPTWDADCSAFSGNYLPVGHTVSVDDDIANIEFGNHTQVAIDCSEGDVVIAHGGIGTDDNPYATVKIPQGTASCDGVPWTTTFDLGLSSDTDIWTQFVIFGGVPTAGAEVMEQMIIWDAAPAVYVLQDINGDTCDPGDVCTPVLQIPTTLVQLELGGELKPIVFCGPLPGGVPNTTTPLCLDHRIIAEGTPLPSGYIQLTEHDLLLGDPNSYR